MVRFGGGLDTTTPPTFMAPGSVIGSENYEPRLQGGYQRAAAYERFDGRARPSDAMIELFRAVTTFTGAAVGDTITGFTSGATGTVVFVTSTLIVLTKVTGSFVAELLKNGAASVGLATAGSGDTALNENAYFAAAATVYRNLIGAVPGSGVTRGIGVLNDVVYAFRDNVGATAQAIYKSTSSGWTLVDLGHEVAFTAGSGTQPAEGATITKGAASAVLRRVVVESGDFSTANAVGRFIINTPSGGNFSAGAFTAGVTATCGGAQTAITLSPGGKWVLQPYNFDLPGTAVRLYGVDGANRPIEFDGVTLVPINTGMTGIFATTMEVHRNHLFVAYGSSVQHCGIGNPYQWSIISGSGELSAGEPVTEMISVAGGENEAAMLILCRNRAHTLYGTSSVNWKLTPQSSTVGARAFSAQPYDSQVIAFDDQGVRNYTPTAAYGNLLAGTLTDHLRDAVTGLTVNASVLDRNGGRYRVFFSDGRWLSGAPGKRWSWMLCRYPFAVQAVGAGEINGIPRIFIGGSDGYVYETDVGRSFDGAAIEYWFKTTYGHMGSPGQRKAFRRFDIEVRGKSAGQLSVQPDFDGGDPNLDAGRASIADTPPPTWLWDGVGGWDTGAWDGRFTAPIRMRSEGIGETCSMVFYGRAASELPHEATSAVVYYIPRRGVR